jgi:hypothetical protein
MVPPLPPPGALQRTSRSENRHLTDGEKICDGLGSAMRIGLWSVVQTGPVWAGD